jgi:hypothetical protein
MGSYILCTSRKYSLRCREASQAESEILRGSVVVTTLVLLSGVCVGDGVDLTESSSAGNGGGGSGMNGFCGSDSTDLDFGGNELITAKCAN